MDDKKGLFMIQKQINTLSRKIKNIFTVGKINSVDSDYNVQATFDIDDTKDTTLLAQHYGFSSRPQKNTDVYGICSGTRDDLIIIASNDKSSRPKLDSGEVSIYTDEKDSITLRRGNKIEVKTGSFSVVNKTTNDELISILYDVISAIEQSFIPTQAGPQPLSNKALLTQALVKIKGFL